jgi:hypothetical protein
MLTAQVFQLLIVWEQLSVFSVHVFQLSFIYQSWATSFLGWILFCHNGTEVAWGSKATIRLPLQHRLVPQPSRHPRKSRGSNQAAALGLGFPCMRDPGSQMEIGICSKSIQNQAALMTVKGGVSWRLDRGQPGMAMNPGKSWPSLGPGEEEDVKAQTSGSHRCRKSSLAGWQRGPAGLAPQLLSSSIFSIFLPNLPRDERGRAAKWHHLWRSASWDTELDLARIGRRDWGKKGENITTGTDVYQTDFIIYCTIQITKRTEALSTHNHTEFVYRQIFYLHHLFPSFQFTDEDTDKAQRGRGTWGRLQSMTSAWKKKTSLFGGVPGLQSLPHSSTQQGSTKHCPWLPQCPPMVLGKGQVAFKCLSFSCS